MKLGINRRLWLVIGLIAFVGSAPIASAAGTTLSVATTPLGKIVVNGKGMTAYFYDLDKSNSGVSACTGGCLANWSPIISNATTPTFANITGKVRVLAHTKQIVINGRPIYTFIGDSAKGATHGQGVGGVWFAISPNGTEMNPSNMAKLKRLSAPTKPKTAPRNLKPTASPAPSTAGKSSISPTPTATAAPTNTPTTGTYANSDY